MKQTVKRLTEAGIAPEDVCRIQTKKQGLWGWARPSQITEHNGALHLDGINPYHQEEWWEITELTEDCKEFVLRNLGKPLYAVKHGIAYAEWCFTVDPRAEDAVAGDWNPTSLVRRGKRVASVFRSVKVEI